MIESLDIRRPPPHSVRIGKLWTEIAGYDKDQDGWRQHRVALHIAEAEPIFSAATRRRPQRRLRAWRVWTHAALMLMASAAVVIATYYLLRKGLLW